VDDAAHIILAAELTNSASDAGELPVMLRAVQANLGELPRQALADTGYRSEDVFEALAGCGTELVVALGREGKQPLQFEPRTTPRTAEMAARLRSDDGKAAYRRRKWIAEPPNGRIKNVLGFRQFSMRGAAPSQGGVEARVHGAELAKDVRPAGRVKAAGHHKRAPGLGQPAASRCSADEPRWPDGRPLTPTLSYKWERESKASAAQTPRAHQGSAIGLCSRSNTPTGAIGNTPVISIGLVAQVDDWCGTSGGSSRLVAGPKQCARPAKCTSPRPEWYSTSSVSWQWDGVTLGSAATGRAGMREDDGAVGRH
jgi:hypothetical protein